MISKLSVTVYLILALYGSTTIQTRLFLKNIKNFLWLPEQYLLDFFILEKQLANIPYRDFLFPVILFYSTLLAVRYPGIQYPTIIHG
jgi:hypothetical protein